MFLLIPIQESCSLKLCFSTFSMKFRHAIGITHMNPNHDPLSDSSDPLSQFAGYGSNVQHRLGELI